MTLSGDTDLAQQLTKDPFILDFLDVDGRISERQLEDALIHRLERFMLELGRGFSFVGRQVRLNVGGDEYFIDLLFFHIPTLRYVVLELKIEKFKPEHLGQLDFYVKVVDDQYRTPVKHAETVGILLCPDKDDVVVEYAIRGRMTPLTVNRYALTGLTPDEEAALPSPAALKEALRTPAPDERQQLRFSDAFPGWQEAPAPSE